MALQFDIWTLLLATGIFQGLVLVVVLFSKRRHGSQNVFLALLLLLLSLSLFDYLLLHSNLYTRLAHMALLSQPLLFLIGPLYYFYIRSMLHQPAKLQAKDAFHFTLILIPIVYLFSFYVLPFDEKVTMLEAMRNNEHPRLNTPIIIGMVLHTLQTLIYIGASYRKIKSEESIASNNKLRFKWLKAFSIYFASFWTFVFIVLITLSSTGFLTKKTDYIVMLMAALSIDLLAFIVLSGHKLWEQHFSNDPSKKKYTKSALSDEKIESLVLELSSHMTEEKVFLNPKLRLTDLAQALSISTNSLSQVLNLGLGKTFNDFVNEYRFEEFRNRLLNTDLSRITIYGIAQESGFNNKYTYTQVFKKFTQMTPSEYLKAHSQQAGAEQPNDAFPK